MRLLPADAAMPDHIGRRIDATGQVVAPGFIDLHSHGGLIILYVERRNHGHERPARVESVDEMSTADALKVGLAQSFALIPGTSRSGATIIGGMLFGLSRKAATEFSFFLAIPTLLGATAYSVLKQRELLSMGDLPMFGLGGLAAFASAFLCVRWLLRYISTHDFTIFAWYRIVFGILVLVTAHFDLVNWAHYSSGMTAIPSITTERA